MIGHVGITLKVGVRFLPFFLAILVRGKNGHHST